MSWWGFVVPLYAPWKPRQVVKGCKNDLMQGQSGSWGSFIFWPIHPRSLISECIDTAAEGVQNVWPGLLHLPPVYYKWEHSETNSQFGSSEISSLSLSVGGELPRRTLRGLLIKHMIWNKVRAAKSEMVGWAIINVYQLESLFKHLLEEIGPLGDRSPEKHL